MGTREENEMNLCRITFSGQLKGLLYSQMVQTWNLFILLRASHDQCKKGTILWAKLKKNAYVDRPKGFPRISGILTIQWIPFLFEREIWHFNFNLTMFAYVCRFLSFSYVNSSTYLILKILSDITIFFSFKLCLSLPVLLNPIPLSISHD